MTNLVLGSISAMLIAGIGIGVIEQATGAKFFRTPRLVQRYTYRGRH
jgi:hypothetical protein